MKKYNTRLAFREEGALWNCYIAPPTGMQGAVLLGSIRMSALAHNVVNKTAFMGLMKMAAEEHFKECHGTELVEMNWNDPVAAPENERTKNAS